MSSIAYLSGCPKPSKLICRRRSAKPHVRRKAISLCPGIGYDLTAMQKVPTELSVEILKGPFSHPRRDDGHSITPNHTKSSYDTYVWRQPCLDDFHQIMIKFQNHSLITAIELQDVFTQLWPSKVLPTGAIIQCQVDEHNKSDNCNQFYTTMLSPVSTPTGLSSTEFTDSSISKVLPSAVPPMMETLTNTLTKPNIRDVELQIVKRAGEIAIARRRGRKVDIEYNSKDVKKLRKRTRSVSRQTELSFNFLNDSHNELLKYIDDLGGLRLAGVAHHFVKYTDIVYKSTREPEAGITDDMRMPQFHIA
jgi:hypothetical protein